MRAAVLSDDLRVQDWPEPEPKRGEALVSLNKVGICGSDTHFVIDGTARPAYRPIVLGHEPAGRVEALGPDTEGPAIGTRVAIIPLITCQECDRCKAGMSTICKNRLCIGADTEGCWADLTTVPVRNLIELPDELTDLLAAVATDSVATAYHAVKRGGVGPGSRVAVWGTGGLGLSSVGISKTLGAETVIAVDPREEARQWSLETGADEALHPDQALKRITELGGVDTALEFVGREESVEGAVRSLDDRGRAVIVGVGGGKAVASKIMTFVLREREMVGSYGAEPEEVRETVEMMAAGKFNLPRVVGDVIPLEDVKEGVERVARGETGGSRIIVDIAAG
jgi:D-arabinose 1-dehydrogenase-like Zn-dependent alcohol dehydrogenase